LGNSCEHIASCDNPLGCLTVVQHCRKTCVCLGYFYIRLIRKSTIESVTSHNSLRTRQVSWIGLHFRAQHFATMTGKQEVPTHWQSYNLFVPNGFDFPTSQHPNFWADEKTKVVLRVCCNKPGLLGQQTNSAVTAAAGNHNRHQMKETERLSVLKNGMLTLHPMQLHHSRQTNRHCFARYGASINWFHFSSCGFKHKRLEKPILFQHINAKCFQIVWSNLCSIVGLKAMGTKRFE